MPVNSATRLSICEFDTGCYFSGPLISAVCCERVCRGRSKDTPEAWVVTQSPNGDEGLGLEKLKLAWKTGPLEIRKRGHGTV